MSLDICSHRSYQKFYVCCDAAIMEPGDKNFHYHCYNCLQIIKNKGQWKNDFVLSIKYYPAKSHNEILTWSREAK